ncbi:MAG: TIGR00730 family Rossman fold protein, partial [Bacteriovorax sp.]
FYDSLNVLVQTMVDKGFLKEVNQQMLLVSENIDELLDKMRNYVAPTVEKWINKETV